MADIPSRLGRASKSFPLCLCTIGWLVELRLLGVISYLYSNSVDVDPTRMRDTSIYFQARTRLQ